MDEIDAALDFRNVSIVANYIKDRTKNAQFIIISLRYDILLAFDLPFLIHLNRNDMFELSHRLIGIYKTSNQTRSMCCLMDVVTLIWYFRHLHRQSFFAINNSCSSKYSGKHDSLI